jgi:DNA-nicking Smr family endonuclease
MSRRRPLSDEDLTLWRYVTRNVTPTHGRPSIPSPRHPEAEAPDPSPRPAITETPRPAPSRPAPPRALVLGASDGIDRRTSQKFSRGEMFIDGRLDLHGMTLKEAQAAVQNFIRNGAATGRRCILIITGKGRTGSSDGHGRIRREALHWLDHPSLRPHILAVNEARQQHGGSGALYVLLKRIRAS